MLTPKKVFRQIQKLTEEIIQSGLTNAENFPSVKQKPNGVVDIGISAVGHSLCLKDIPYADMYHELDEKKQYNLRMVDGALITLLYKFRGDELEEHRLSFFPAPHLEMFQNESKFYMEDELYLDVFDKRVVAVPLRFDFDAGKAFVPIRHPKSHLTLGQYKHCRIPVSSAVSPHQFLTFILWNFYHTKDGENLCNLTKYDDKFDVSIVPDETGMIHVCTSASGYG